MRSITTALLIVATVMLFAVAINAADPPVRLQTNNVNECATNNGGCSSHATCTNTQSSRTCVCQVGYSGNGISCVDVNECANGNGGCSSQATCTNTVGSRTCACKIGYTGTGLVCTNVNECATANGGCSSLATCFNTVGSRTCACNTGYAGTGVACTDVNECAVSNGGCSSQATCTNTAGSRTCACNSGYIGSGTSCTDINECATSNGGCSSQATCTNTVGSRTCACKTGYAGTGLVCADVNECASANGGCSSLATCANTVGSRTCACNTGYAGTGVSCSDVNECAVGNGGCDAQAFCFNTPGSRQCSCKPGFTGNGLACTWSGSSSLLCQLFGICGNNGNHDDDDDMDSNGFPKKCFTDPPCICPKGPIGNVGPQGVVGPQGPPGSNGHIGRIGVDGPKGPKGIQGVQGIQGIQGPYRNGLVAQYSNRPANPVGENVFPFQTIPNWPNAFPDNAATQAVSLGVVGFTVRYDDQFLPPPTSAGFQFATPQFDIPLSPGWYDVAATITYKENVSPTANTRCRGAVWTALAGSLQTDLSNTRWNFGQFEMGSFTFGPTSRLVTDVNAHVFVPPAAKGSFVLRCGIVCDLGITGSAPVGTFTVHTPANAPGLTSPTQVTIFNRAV